MCCIYNSWPYACISGKKPCSCIIQSVSRFVGSTCWLPRDKKSCSIFNPDYVCTDRHKTAMMGLIVNGSSTKFEFIFKANIGWLTLFGSYNSVGIFHRKVGVIWVVYYFCTPFVVDALMLATRFRTLKNASFLGGYFFASCWTKSKTNHEWFLTDVTDSIRKKCV